MKKVGRYEVQGEIGRGGMATVYRAWDPLLKRDVAIKVLPREMMQNLEFIGRFQQELRMVSLLEHNSIVPVYDSGETRRQPYFVMRYMTGGSLKDKLKKGPLSLAETAVIIEKIAQGLSYAHKKGIIHRDIKPDNILFDAMGEPHLSDFGVAKLIEDAQSWPEISSTGSRVVGTPAYLSPEQAVGENEQVDHRSDIYGLGVLTFEMLTGEQPYKADTPMQVTVKHIRARIPNITDLNPDLPPVLDRIIKTAMAKKKEKRYQSVLEFALALSGAAFGKERTLPAELVLERRRIAQSKRRRQGWYIGGALSLVVLAAGFFSRPILAPLLVSTPTPTSTATATVTALPSMTPSIVPPSLTPSSTATITATSTFTAIPTPLGGASGIALLYRNSIIKMNLDGSGLITLDGQNFEKANLQWTADGRLFYIAPDGHCVYSVAAGPQRVICFRENLTAFRISPDGMWVAISLDNILYIVPFREELLRGTGVTKDLLLIKDENICRYTQSIKDVRWSTDSKRVAALVVDPGQNNSEQIHIFNVDPSRCNSGTSLSLIAINRFPANSFGLENFDYKRQNTIPSFDWDGDHRFLLNDSLRNDVFGNLYLYDSDKREGIKLEPLGPCCYREARWSPDQKYVLFLYQGQFESEIHLYYIPAAELMMKGEWTPIDMDPNTFQPRELAYPVIRPAE